MQCLLLRVCLINGRNLSLSGTITNCSCEKLYIEKNFATHSHIVSLKLYFLNFLGIDVKHLYFLYFPMKVSLSKIFFSQWTLYNVHFFFFLVMRHFFFCYHIKVITLNICLNIERPLTACSISIWTCFSVRVMN